ncbi:peptidoglycan DD-metalloendopeptidase family protein [Kordia sp. TARA_039_SRF]|nr:peptidoglycan DD-metalloendopeptidase family protein [Kordia sp. TARA_039_SRF]
MKLIIQLLFLLSITIIFAQEKEILTFDKKIDGKTVVYGKNNTSFTYSVQLNMKGTGCKANKRLPITVVIPPKGEVKLFDIVPTKKQWRYTTNYDYVIGDVKAIPNKTFTYDLPFAKGSTHRVSQGYHGSFSHQGKYALDFSMPEGTPIHAIRTGKVIKIKKDSDTGCPTKKCIEQANYVWIAHKDGTIAEYAHLQLNGTHLQLGEIVQKGDKVGLSGNTGFSQAPHLHLQVFVQGFDGKRKTIPTKYKANGKVVKSLKKGNEYTNKI